MSLAEHELTATPPAEGDLPEGWALTVLDEAIQLNPPKPSPDVLLKDAPVTFVPMPSVDAGSGTIAVPLERPFWEVRSGFTAFADGDVIMAKITPCMENGKAAIARGLTNGLGFGSTEFHVLRSNGAALPEYVYHFIRQETFRRLAESEMTGSVGQRRVPADFLRGTEFPLAPLAEQRRIVAKAEQLLAAASTTRTRLARVPTLLKRFRQSVLAAACSGRLTADWRQQNPDVEPASRLLERILAERRAKWEGEQRVKTRKRPSGTLEMDLAGSVVDPLFRKQQVSGGAKYQEPAAPDVGELPELPEEWCWTTFGLLLSELRNGIGVRPSIDPPGVPMLRISSVRPGKVSLDEFRFLPKADELASTYRLRDGDLLFTRYNGSLDFLGVCGMVRNLEDRLLLYPDKLMRVRFDHSYIDPAFAEIFFQSPLLRGCITAKSKSSAGQQGVTGEDIKTLPFALVPVEEQQEIVRRVERLFHFAEAIEKRTAAAAGRADRLTQAILAKAFRGELVPTEAELARAEGRGYETASVLLKRVQAEQPGRPGRAIKPALSVKQGSNGL